MSYSKIALTGMFAVLVTYSSITYGIHHKEVLRSEILRSDRLTVCNDGHCVNLEKHEPLPQEMNVNAPLGKEYVLNKKEVRCLAKNIREESASSHYQDRIANAWGVINRVKSKRFPNTICGVIYQKGQMSWTKSKVKRNRGFDKVYIKIAKDLLLGKIPNPSKACNFTGWYNVNLDSKKSYNYRKMMTVASCVYKPKGTPHFYISEK